MSHPDLDKAQVKYAVGYAKYLRWLAFLFSKFLVTPSTLDESDENFKRPT